MITKNFMACVIGSMSQSSYVTTRKVDGEEYNASGYSMMNWLNYISNDRVDYSVGGGQGMRLLLGSGDNSASIDDYKIESLVTDYSILAHSKTSIGTYDKLCTVFSRTIEADSDITIKECGIVSIDNSGNALLFAREVLSEPVILRSGEKHTFTMTISLE